MKGEKYHLILMVLVTIAIIGGLASIVIWYTQPDLRMTLVVDYTEASIAAAIVAILNVVALLVIRMKSKWGPLLVIAITVPNRILGLLHFEVSSFLYLLFHSQNIQLSPSLQDHLQS